GRVPPGFFAKMGMQDLPATGDYFVSLRTYSQQTGSAPDANFDAVKRLSERPWTASENATISGWLKANEKPLVTVHEATKRTHYYSPIIPETDANGSKGLISSLLPGPQACRELASALLSRAMLNLGHNQPAAAWQELLACHRLARLVG